MGSRVHRRGLPKEILAEVRVSLGLLADPEVDLTQCLAPRLEVAFLPGVVVLQSLPTFVLRLNLSAEPPAVLVIDRHDVCRVGSGEPGSISNNQEVLVIGAARLRAEIVRAGE